MGSNSMPITRLAPSPTGALHLGNARTFLINWALARQRGWRVVMRMEDLDGPRVKPGAAEQALAMLDWLGLDWDGPVTYQSTDFSPYHEALRKLHDAELIYHCRCSRKDIAAAQSAPHEGGEMRYPGTCRPGPRPSSTGLNQETALANAKTKKDVNEPSPSWLTEDAVAWRLFVPDEGMTFADAIAGPQAVNVQQQAGDFIVATKAGLPSYQLAVVVDDARQGVTHIVRGDDLLASTARQLWLYRDLGLSPIPCYFHLPLVRGSDGRRLAKRHDDTRLVYYCEAGVSPDRLVGLMAYWSSMIDAPAPMSAAEFRDRFDLATMSTESLTFTEEEHQWLLDHAKV